MNQETTEKVEQTPDTFDWSSVLTTSGECEVIKGGAPEETAKESQETK